MNEFFSPHNDENKKKKKSTILEESQKNYFLHEHHTIHFERSIKYLVRISHDRCMPKLSHQKFPHTLTSRPRDRTKRKNYSRADYTRQRESLSIACNADLRLTSPFVPPLSPLLYTRINARAWARQARNTHARTHALDWIILEHEPRAMISMNTRCARAARENEMSSADGKPWKKVVRSHGSLAGVVGAAPRE